METATGDSAYNLKTRSQKANIDPVNEIQLLKKVSNESPEVQALIHHNLVSHGKSGGSLRSQSGTLKEGSIGHGKSGGSQMSGMKYYNINIF